jgi:hypothetical protein
VIDHLDTWEERLALAIVIQALRDMQMACLALRRKGLVYGRDDLRTIRRDLLTIYRSDRASSFEMLRSASKDAYKTVVLIDRVLSLDRFLMSDWCGLLSGVNRDFMKYLLRRILK